MNLTLSVLLIVAAAVGLFALLAKFKKQPYAPSMQEIQDLKTEAEAQSKKTENAKNEYENAKKKFTDRFGRGPDDDK